MITEIGPGVYGLCILMFPIFLIIFTWGFFFVVHVMNLNNRDTEEEDKKR